VSTEDGNGRASNPDAIAPVSTGAITDKLPPALRKNVWKPGQSGNPSGRPKQSREFRAKSRELAMKLMDKLIEQVDNPAKSVVSVDGDKVVYGPGIGELTRSLEVVAAHGGLLTADKLATVEAAFARMLLAIAAAENLTTDQKQLAIAQANQLHAEAVGDEDE
jgi:hypothetical protein